MTATVLDNLPQLANNLWEVLQRRIGTQRLLLMLNVLALALFTSSLATWTWRLLEPEAPKLQIASSTGDPTAPRLDIQSLLNAYLFGKLDVPTTADLPSPSQVPLSSLNLVLTGVVVAGDDSIALISSASDPQQAFTLGEEITHGAVLHAVYADRAILMRAGVLESLILEEPSVDIKTNRGIPGRPPVTPPAPTSNNIRKLGHNQFSVPRNLISEQINNPAFLRQARIIPREDGFYVRNLNRGSLYEKLGLQQGDVIRSINGEPVRSLQDAMKHYQNLGSTSQIQLEVLRKGQSEMLQFRLD